MKMAYTLSLLAFAGAVLCGTSAMAAKDNFDRSDLGKKWVVPAGDGRLYITNDALQGDTLSLGYFKKSGGDSAVTATLILGGTDLEYGAIAVGDVASGNNVFAKLQEQNGSGEFEYGGLYVGNNGGGFFFQLNSPVASPANVTVSVCGTVATMTIKSSSGKQVYSYDYGTSFPTGGGLGTYGLISLDNYKSKAASCTADLRGATVLRGTSKIKDLSLQK